MSLLQTTNHLKEFLCISTFSLPWRWRPKLQTNKQTVSKISLTNEQWGDPLSSMQALWGQHEPRHHFWGQWFCWFSLERRACARVSSLSVDDDGEMTMGRSGWGDDDGEMGREGDGGVGRNDGGSRGGWALGTGQGGWLEERMGSKWHLLPQNLWSWGLGMGFKKKRWRFPGDSNVQPRQKTLKVWFSCISCRWRDYLCGFCPEPGHFLSHMWMVAVPKVLLLWSNVVFSLTAQKVRCGKRVL